LAQHATLVTRNVPFANQPSKCRAACSSAAGAEPPPQIGGPPGWYGVGPAFHDRLASWQQVFPRKIYRESAVDFVHRCFENA
jgi:hypothetical protein